MFRWSVAAEKFVKFHFDDSCLRKFLRLAACHSEIFSSPTISEVALPKLWPQALA